jgi:hypothetical protein
VIQKNCSGISSNIRYYIHYDPSVHFFYSQNDRRKNYAELGIVMDHPKRVASNSGCSSSPVLYKKRAYILLFKVRRGKSAVQVKYKFTKCFIFSFNAIFSNWYFYDINFLLHTFCLQIGRLFVPTNFSWKRWDKKRLPKGVSLNINPQIFFYSFQSSNKPIRRWSSLKIGVFNGQLPKKYKLFDQILLSSDKFKQKSGTLKFFLNVTDGSSNPKRAYKTVGFLIKFPLFSR